MTTPAEELVRRLARIKTLQEELERACAATDHQRQANDRVRAEIEEARRNLDPPPKG